jgi:uncharacterized alkaline shock family protein YloU
MSEQRSPLQTDRGSTTIADGVVTMVAGMAAREVEGVEMGGGGRRLPGDSSPTVSELLSGVGARDGSVSRGVFVEVGDGEATVDLHAKVEYGRPVQKVSEELRRNVIRRVENLTGLRVREVNVTVADIFLPEQESE